MRACLGQRGRSDTNALAEPFRLPNRPIRPSRPRTPHGKLLRCGAGAGAVFVTVVSAGGAASAGVGRSRDVGVRGVGVGVGRRRLRPHCRPPCHCSGRPPAPPRAAASATAMDHMSHGSLLLFLLTRTGRVVAVFLVCGGEIRSSRAGRAVRSSSTRCRWCPGRPSRSCVSVRTRRDRCPGPRRGRLPPSATISASIMRLRMASSFRCCFSAWSTMPGYGVLLQTKRAVAAKANARID